MNPRRTLRRQTLVALGLTGLLGFGAGCSPEYNWREVRPADGGFQVMFPGKPSSAGREILLDGQKVSMKMHAAQAGGHSFAVGVVALPADNEVWRERMLAAMQAQMARNIGATQPVVSPIEVPIIDSQGTVRARVSGQRVDARGGGQPNRMQGGFVARGARAYQFLVIGSDPDAETMQIFIDSFRLID